MEGFPLSIRFPLHWGDMDAFGHVNNARYLTYFESSRLAYLDRLGLFVRGLPEGVNVILAHASADYLRPLVYPEELVVGTRVVKLGTTSITLAHEVRGSDGTLYARGTSVVVTVRYPAVEKVPVPEAVRRKVEVLEGRSLSSD
ncbi:MAG: acyl-CoA thioesterase [Myxococcaceae bacterium]|nr:acyl-CoA thioesterase [Myxococcaceae bacterium]MCI0672907.1 acyl-CoA thioesterase [Myxococcaceae bacterium]